jgi:hypothetical protein
MKRSSSQRQLRAGNGSFEANRVTVGKNGVAPPM